MPLFSVEYPQLHSTWANVTPGTGVTTALAVNVGSAGAFVAFNGALGTPTSGTLTNCTGLPTAGLADDAVTFAKMQNIATAKVLGRTTASTGDVEELATTGTGSVVLSASPTFTGTVNTAAILATGSIASSSHIRTSGPTTGIGYTTGSGGTVTQATSKSTGVAINRSNGTVTMNGAALAAAAVVTFTMTNNAIEANDLIVAQHHATGTFGAYLVNAHVTGATTADFTITNVSGGSLSEAIVIKFALIKSVIA